MSNLMQQKWNDTHLDPKFRSLYPHDSVVRFVFRHFVRDADKHNKTVLDIGCGSGRHLKLVAENGIQAAGCDYASVGVQEAGKILEGLTLKADLTVCDFTQLPYADQVFDGALAWGVLYYGNKTRMQQGISELHRVLKTTGVALLLLKSCEDLRYGLGREIEKNTFFMEDNQTNEQGMTLCFLDENELRDLFKDFSVVTMNKNNYYANNLSQLHSDWIIELTK
ncbi:MAG: class I SAM-dependent methyltransferase [Methylococcaceae bacterium]|nr:class I SAM-dependent methyltransferase [Methylococcaceae bacterium]